MPIFKGFNTIGQDKKFSIVDYTLIKRDLLNAFMIKEGEVPGKPEVGTKIWSFIFEPLDSITIESVEEEVRRIVKRDPRLTLASVDIATIENIIEIDMRIIIHPDTNPETLYLIFDKDSQTASIS